MRLPMCVFPCVQYGLFTTVHKHYTVEDWVGFAKAHPNCLKVLCVHVCVCGNDLFNSLLIHTLTLLCT